MKKEKIFLMSTDLSVITPLKSSFDVETTSSRSALVNKIKENHNVLVVVDADIEERPVDLFREITRSSPGTRFIIVSSAITIPEAVEAARNGVSDIIKKPVLAEKLIESVKKNLYQDLLQFKFKTGPTTLWLNGGNRMRVLFSSIEAALRARKNICFIAEPGIDVASIAKIVHGRERSDKLSVIDIISFQKENAESIFWTVLQKALAEASTVYIDNFSVVPAKQQASIIEYIASRAGKGQTVMLNASSHDVALELGHWEKIYIPALRERKEDLPLLISAYLGKYCQRHGRKITSVSLDALDMLTKYSWPGNYRELACELENSVVSCEGETLGIKCLELCSRMVMENIVSPHAESLLEFKNVIEKNLVNIMYGKTMSEDSVSAALDITKNRVTDNIIK